MVARHVRTDYAQLNTIAQAFAQQATAARQTYQALQRAKAELAAGAWVGRGATAFYAEMDACVLPALTRLGAAFEAAHNVTGQMARILHQAEADAAALFRLGVTTAPTPPAPQWEAEGFGWWAAAFAQQHGRAPSAEDYAEFRLSWQLSGEGQVQWTGADWEAFYHAQRRGLADWVAEGTIRPPLSGAGALAAVNQLNQAVIQKRIDENRYQEAIDLAILAYEIDTTGAAAPPSFNQQYAKDETTYASGHVDATRRPKIGPGAFTSPGYLASTIEHEMLHVRQTLAGRLYATVQGMVLNEVEAFDWELARAQYFGLTAAEVATLQEARQGEYAKLTPENQQRADHGQYMIPGAPVYPPAP